MSINADAIAIVKSASRCSCRRCCAAAVAAVLSAQYAAQAAPITTIHTMPSSSSFAHAPAAAPAVPAAATSAVAAGCGARLENCRRPAQILAASKSVAARHPRSWDVLKTWIRGSSASVGPAPPLRGGDE
eukprot:CAMPEP_0179477646 /NCGR_PEP_ID=MMETSP0799-20121207/56343_1 /TAXON_ID=46947 /ORGANISM="Geminigera cryophila, Strain CCMP2564" /LENGTH=129 /DNA_ID=CAMNT_0021288399 /DNA_START=674 /DNA_END=1064 /DNA_ORIENTATION=-